MKLRLSLCVLILLIGMAVVGALVWRSIVELRSENRLLRVAKRELEQVCRENAQQLETFAQHDIREESLRGEIADLQAQLHGFHLATEQAKAMFAQASQKLIETDRSRPNSLRSPVLPKRELSHLNTSALTNMTFISSSDFGYTSYFSLDEMEFGSGISRADMITAPDWSLSEPLPLSLNDAEQAARSELRKLVNDDRQWVASEIGLHRSDRSLQKWHYRVTLVPVGGHWLQDRFTAYVALNGKPGTIGLRQAK
jgi:hypothetical protein